MWTGYVQADSWESQANAIAFAVSVVGNGSCNGKSN